ncbi:MAG: hypothetical protein ACFBSE_26610 [Prochloraceae cyanobacterium]
MEAYKRISLGLAFLLLSCQSNSLPESIDNSKKNSERETILVEKERDKPSKSALPRTIKIEMRLYDTKDLKVKTGDLVKAGQVIGDRSLERDKLLFQKSQLQTQLSRLNVDNLYVPILSIAKLPPANYQVEEINITLAENKLNDAKLQVSDRIEKISKLQSVETLPQLDIDKIIQHERSILNNLEAEVKKAAIQVNLARANLALAQQNRQYREYLHQLEIYKRSVNLSRQKLELARQEEKVNYQKSQIKSQINQIDKQISQLTEVRSPYDGTIKKVKWAGQSDNIINVVVTLAVESDSSESPTETESDSTSLFR